MAILERLRSVSEEILSSHTVADVLANLLRQSVDLLGATGGGIYRYTAKSSSFCLISRRGLSDALDEKTYSLEQGAIGLCIRERGPFINNAYKTWEHRLRDLDKEGVIAVACSPILLVNRTFGASVWGAIAIHTTGDTHSFGADSGALLCHLANLAAIALQDARKSDELERLKNCSFDAIIAVDESGKVTSFNSQAERILGYSAHEVTGTDVRRLYVPESDASVVKQRLIENDIESLSLADRGRLEGFSTAVRSKRGEEIPIRLSAALHRDYTGARTGSVGYFRDARLDIKVQQLSRLLELLQSLNHIDNPLLIIRAAAAKALELFDLTSLAVYRKASNNNRAGYFLRHLVVKEAGLGDRLLQFVPLQLCAKNEPIFVDRLSPGQMKAAFGLSVESNKESLVFCPIGNRDSTFDAFSFCFRTPRFLDEDRVSVRLYARIVRAAFSSARLLEQRAQEAEEVSKAAASLTETLDLDSVLERLMRSCLSLSSADETTILLYDPVSQRFASEALELSSAEQPLRKYKTQVRQSGGYAHYILQQSEPVFIPDAEHDKKVSPVAHKKGRRAAAGFALRNRDKAIGVLYISWRHAREFSRQERDLLSTMASHAAVAIHNAKYLESLECLNKSLYTLSNTFSILDLRQAIVDSGVQLFGAAYAVLWTYDSGEQRFVPGVPVASGLSYEVYSRLVDRQSDPWNNEERAWMDRTILFSKGTAAIDGFSFKDSERVQDFIFDHLEITERASVFIEVLEIAGEVIGVFCLGYDESMGPSGEARSQLEEFCRFSALCLKKSRLLVQVNTVEFLSDVNVAVGLLREDDAILKKIVEGTRSVLRCDLVSLYTDGSPVRYVVSGSEGTKEETLGALPAFWRSIIDNTHPQIADDATLDWQEIEASDYAKKHNIKSCVALPLWASGDPVGIMMVGYAALRRFSSAEISNINLFAGQAAIAIRNSQIYKSAKRSSDILRRLNKAGHRLAGSLSLQATVTSVADGAREFFGFIWPGSCLACVSLLEKKKLQVVAASLLGNSDVAQEIKSLGIEEEILMLSAKAITGGEKISTREVRSSTIRDLSGFNVKYEIAASLEYGNEKVGVLSIWHSGVVDLGGETLQAIELFCAHSAIAIRNARQHELLREAKGLVGSRTALAWMGMTGSTWRHRLHGHGLTVRNEVAHLQDLLGEKHGIINNEIARTLDRISKTLEELLAQPVAPPLPERSRLDSVGINDHLKHCVEQMRKEGRLNGIEIKYKLWKTRRRSVLIDRAWLFQVVDVIIDNAADAIRRNGSVRKGKIKIETKSNEGGVEILIQDNGAGVSAKLAPLLFIEAVSRAREGRKSEGLGVGLVMVAAIMQRFGGKAWLESAGGKGVGATVGLWLPGGNKS